MISASAGDSAWLQYVEWGAGLRHLNTSCRGALNRSQPGHGGGPSEGCELFCNSCFNKQSVIQTAGGPCTLKHGNLETFVTLVTFPNPSQDKLMIWFRLLRQKQKNFRLAATCIIIGSRFFNGFPVVSWYKTKKIVKNPLQLLSGCSWHTIYANQIYLCVNTHIHKNILHAFIHKYTCYVSRKQRAYLLSQ